jgi:hypothetical protein
MDAEERPSAALDALDGLTMKPELVAWWKEGADLAEHLKAEKAAREGAEHSALAEKVQRYETALLRIVEQPREHEALIDHREKDGPEVSAGDRQVLHAYRETAKITASALRLGPAALL